MDRRKFVGHFVASVGSAAALAASVPFVTADDEKSPPVSDEKKPEKNAEPDARPPIELLILTALIQRYPSEHYDEASLKGILNDIRGDIARGRILSSFPLQNSDEPAFAFRPYRAVE
jgi:hypothetical protein